MIPSVNIKIIGLTTLTRVDNSHLPRYMLSYKPIGKRSLGRPRKRWMSQTWGAATDESPNAWSRRRRRKRRR